MDIPYKPPYKEAQQGRDIPITCLCLCPFGVPNFTQAESFGGSRSRQGLWVRVGFRGLGFWVRAGFFGIVRKNLTNHSKTAVKPFVIGSRGG